MIFSIFFILLLFLSLVFEWIKPNWIKIFLCCFCFQLVISSLSSSSSFFPHFHKYSNKNQIWWNYCSKRTDGTDNNNIITSSMDDPIYPTTIAAVIKYSRNITEKNKGESVKKGKGWGVFHQCDNHNLKLLLLLLLLFCRKIKSRSGRWLWYSS